MTQLITGNTYPVRSQLKALGARWNRGAQGWEVPIERVAEARIIVDGAGPAVEYRGRRRDRRTAYHRGDPSSGARRSHYDRDGVYSHDGQYLGSTRPRCEDAPCCGCCP